MEPCDRRIVHHRHSIRAQHRQSGTIRGQVRFETPLQHVPQPSRSTRRSNRRPTIDAHDPHVRCLARLSNVRTTSRRRLDTHRTAGRDPRSSTRRHHDSVKHCGLLTKETNMESEITPWSPVRKRPIPFSITLRCDSPARCPLCGATLNPNATFFLYDIAWCYGCYCRTDNYVERTTAMINLTRKHLQCTIAHNMTFWTPRDLRPMSIVQFINQLRDKDVRDGIPDEFTDSVPRMDLRRRHPDGTQKFDSGWNESAFNPTNQP